MTARRRGQRAHNSAFACDPLWWACGEHSVVDADHLGAEWLALTHRRASRPALEDDEHLVEPLTARAPPRGNATGRNNFSLL